MMVKPCMVEVTVMKRYTSLQCLFILLSALFVQAQDYGCGAIRYIDSLQGFFCQNRTIQDNATYNRIKDVLTFRYKGCQVSEMEAARNYVHEIQRAGRVVPRLNALLQEKKYPELIRTLLAADSVKCKGKVLSWCDSRGCTVFELGFLFYNYASVDSLLFASYESAIADAVQRKDRESVDSVLAVLDTMKTFLFPARMEVRKRDLRASVRKEQNGIAPPSAVLHENIGEPFFYAVGEQPEFFPEDMVISRIRKAKNAVWWYLTITPSRWAVENVGTAVVSAPIAAYVNPESGAAYGQRLLAFDGIPMEFSSEKTYILFDSIQHPDPGRVIKACAYRFLHFGMSIDIGDDEVFFPVSKSSAYNGSYCYSFLVENRRDPENPTVICMPYTSLSWAGDFDRDMLLDFIISESNDDQTLYEKVPETKALFRKIMKFNSGKEVEKHSY
ncbi:MAG: hypothetical protein JW863_02330 [Chitinispirillaceae bacterium]|nr:hypothetical protein [Chitinispirillaceae bacterium]